MSAVRASLALWLHADVGDLPQNPQNMTQRLTLSLAFLFGSIFLSACTTQQSSLKSAATLEAKTTSEAFTFDSVAGLAKVRSTFVLRPGRYIPVGQDDAGVWYLGAQSSLLIIYVDSPKNRMDGKLATAVYQGGVFVPHPSAQAARIFYVPGSEKFRIADADGLDAGRTEASNFVSDTIIQTTLNSSATPLQAGLSGAIAGAILSYDAFGFKLHPVSPPESRNLRDWLAGAQP